MSNVASVVNPFSLCEYSCNVALCDTLRQWNGTLFMSAVMLHCAVCTLKINFLIADIVQSNTQNSHIVILLLTGYFPVNHPVYDNNTMYIEKVLGRNAKHRLKNENEYKK
jgi:hypothetical protein